MDFVNQLQGLAAKIPSLRDLLHTEEATKNALVMPLLQIMGYNVFDPTEVIPEFVADHGTKKGEKVDYAIALEGKIAMLIECKRCGADLHINHASQLFRYFTVTDARIAILTNGITHRFFTDLEAPNKMDERPFLEVNMLELTKQDITALARLTKSEFNTEAIIEAAGELKYTRQLKRWFGKQLETPDEEFIKFCARQLFDGPLTEKRRVYFTDITKRSFTQFVHEQINARLRAAMSSTAAPEIVEDEVHEEPEQESYDATYEKTIETTTEELEGFYIIKSLLRDIVPPERIHYRDTKSYFGILLDDNNRKPLARLHFNGQQKYLGIFDDQRNEQRVPISGLNEIYEYTDQLRRVFTFYEGEKPEEKIPEDNTIDIVTEQTTQEDPSDIPQD